MILIDNNLSHRIGNSLSKDFLGIKHVSHFGMDENTTDAEIWDFSKAQHFTILTKDTDFEAMSQLFGCPPKVIQLNVEVNLLQN